MKCVACGKERLIYSENVCKECHDKEIIRLELQSRVGK